MTAPTLTALALVCSLKRRPVEALDDIGYTTQAHGCMFSSPMRPPPRHAMRRIWPDCSSPAGTRVTSEREK